MADFFRVQNEGVPSTMVTRYEDMGDTSHAVVVSVDGSDVGLVAGTEVDLAAGAEVGLVAGTAVYLFDETGTAWGVRNVNGKIYALCKPYGYGVAEGNIAGITPVRRFGHNEDVGTAEETVSHIGAVMYYPAAAETLKIKSDDTDDDGAPLGAGARTVWIQGLDGSYGIITDTITMNGTTAVDSNVDFLRVYKAKVMTAGASGWNEGTITVYGADGTSKIDSIDPFENESHSASFTVPANQVVYIAELTITSAGSKGAAIRLYTCESGGLFYLKRSYSIIDTGMVITIGMPLKFTAETDIEMRAEGIIAGAVISAGFVGWREAA